MYRNPYESGEFHEKLLACIYKYFTKADLIDKTPLYNLYCRILSDYNNKKLTYNYEQQIKKVKKKIEKDEKELR